MMPSPQRSERFYAALDQLPQIQRIVYLLAARDSMAFADIAFRIGEDADAVEQHLADALKALVQALADP